LREGSRLLEQSGTTCAAAVFVRCFRLFLVNAEHTLRLMLAMKNMLHKRKVSADGTFFWSESKKILAFEGA
jgi:hypothetical protein